MKLYHLSLEVDNVIEEFFPMLPSAIYHDEDGSISRISISDSIEGCLSGVPWGGIKLENVLFSCEDIFIGDKGLLIRVYEFNSSDVKSSNLLNTEYLLKNGLVMDANVSNEYWIIEQSIKPTNSYIIELTNFEEEIEDVFCQDWYFLNNYDEVDDIEEYLIGSSTKIIDIKYNIVDNIEELLNSQEFLDWLDIKNELREYNFE